MTMRKWWRDVSSLICWDSGFSHVTPREVSQTVVGGSCNNESHSIKNPVCGRYLCAKVYGEKDREKRFFSWLHSAVYNCAQNLISDPRQKNNLVFDGSLHLYKFPSLKKTTTTYFEFTGRVKSQAVPYQALPATRETPLMFSSSGGCSLFI